MKRMIFHLPAREQAAQLWRTLLALPHRWIKHPELTLPFLLHWFSMLAILSADSQAIRPERWMAYTSVSTSVILLLMLALRTHGLWSRAYSDFASISLLCSLFQSAAVRFCICIAIPSRDITIAFTALSGAMFYILGHLLIRSGNRTSWSHIPIKLFFAVALAVFAAGSNHYLASGDPPVVPFIHHSFWGAMAIAAAFLGFADLHPFFRRLTEKGQTGILLSAFIFGILATQGTIPLAYDWMAEHITDHFFDWYQPYYTRQLMTIMYMTVLTVAGYVAMTCGMSFLRRFFEKTERFERVLLSASLIITIGASLFFLGTTTIFSAPMGELGFTYDNIFTSDSGVLIEGAYNAFMSTKSYENDARQILFAAFALPCGVFGYAFAHLAGFFLNIFGHPQYFWHLYGCGIMIAQCIMTSFILLMLYRILKTCCPQYARWFTLLYAVSFSSVLFTFIAEQYIVALFWLILFVYSLVCDRSQKTAAWGLAGAAGSLTTSGAAGFMLILAEKPRLRRAVYIGLSSIGIFLLVALFTGQIGQIIDFKEAVNKVKGFAGIDRMPFQERFVMFLQFIPRMIAAPPMTTKPVHGPPATTMIRVLPDGTAITVLGAVILIFCIAGGVYAFRKCAAARIGLWWVLITAFILAYLGWGAPENGMILYSTYFLWAFIVTASVLYQRLFFRLPRIGRGIMLGLCMGLTVVNLCSLGYILVVAFSRYPVQF